MLGNRFLLQYCVESRKIRPLPAAVVWHTQGREESSLDCGQFHWMRREEGICAMSRVAGTYTAKLFCLPGSQQDSCQRVWAWTN